MNELNGDDISARIIEQAKKMGASLAGIAAVAALSKSPSHTIFSKLDRFRGIGTKESGQVPPGQVAWPADARSAVVVAVEHPEDKPQLDWWQDGLLGGTIGNRMLMDINAKLSEWLKEEKGYKAQGLPYYIENGGIFLKDAAVMAGLGCLGKNNMLVTADYGPRVRLRAMLLDVELPATGPIDFNPCQVCPMPCRTVCPQKAFQNKVYSDNQYGVDQLPARTGVYSRHLCNIQMELDVKNCDKTTVMEQDTPGKMVKYCRLCEVTCPIGRV